MSYTARLLSEQSRLYYLTYGEGKEACYYFLLADPAKESALLKALDGKIPGKIPDFGKVVASGFGEANGFVKSQMQQKYGIEFQD